MYFRQFVFVRWTFNEKKSDKEKRIQYTVGMEIIGFAD